MIEMRATKSVSMYPNRYSHAFADPIHSGHLPPTGSAPINVSMNYFLLDGGRRDDHVYDVPLGILPINPLGNQTYNSMNCQNYSALPFPDEAGGKQVCNWTTTSATHVKYVYRTAGLVSSGKHPYVLVSDDAQKNSSKVAYSWRMNLPDDISSANITLDGADAILTDTLLPGEQRRLLVRMMVHSDPSFRWSISSYNLTIGHKAEMVRVLTGNMTAVKARFRALLFPLRDGDTLPVTEVQPDGETVHLTKPDGTKDTIRFASPESSAHPIHVAAK